MVKKHATRNRLNDKKKNCWLSFCIYQILGILNFVIEHWRMPELKNWWKVKKWNSMCTCSVKSYPSYLLSEQKAHKHEDNHWLQLLVQRKEQFLWKWQTLSPQCVVVCGWGKGKVWLFSAKMADTCEPMLHDLGDYNNRQWSTWKMTEDTDI